MKIVTDSGCDLKKDYVSQHGITVVPMTITFGEEQFRDGIDLTYDEFYDHLEEQLPKTSQVGPYDFKEAFKSSVSFTASSSLKITFDSPSFFKSSI